VKGPSPVESYLVGLGVASCGCGDVTVGNVAQLGTSGLDRGRTGTMELLVRWSKL